MAQTAQGWEFDVERGPDSLFVHLHPPTRGADDEPPLADMLWAVLDQHFVYRLVLELDEIELLRSYLLGQLIMLGRRLHARGGMLRLCGLSPANRQVLEAMRLEGHLPSYASRVEALVGLYPGNPK